MTSSDDDAVAVAYADPAGGTRAVRHAALAAVELTWHRRGDRELTMAGICGAYEYVSDPVTSSKPMAASDGDAAPSPYNPG